ncbi:MAG: CHAT domain-containing protein [Bacteroidetes bacterium]|nr:MAG: CHAT domain-containing protein [Bacteroidota bacterium]
MSKETKSVIFLAYANDRADPANYLRNLVTEVRNIRHLLEDKVGGVYEIVSRGNANLEDILRVFDQYGERIEVFHFAGHADSWQLMLEDAAGHAQAAGAAGLNELLLGQKKLRLVFLNGCTTWQQAADLAEKGELAVIATSRSINDQAAAIFSGRFYERLADGSSVAIAFEAAQTKVHIQMGQGRSLYWEAQQEEELEFPWQLYGRHTDWRLALPGVKKRSGRLLHLMCDRDPQAESFLDRFESLLSREAGDPQYYFIHGPRGERHKSLVRRFREIEIRHHLGRMPAGSGVLVDFYDVPFWPTTGDLDMRKRNLKRSIARSRELPGIVGSKWESPALMALLAQRGNLVVFQHQLAAEKWDSTTFRLLEWYIHDFWMAGSEGASFHFLLFVNIVYPEKWGSFLRRFLGLATSRQDIWEDMQALKRKTPENCTILAELQPITPEDVAAWVDTYFPDNMQHLPGTIFDKQKRLPMKVVETQLKLAIERLERGELL